MSNIPADLKYTKSHEWINDSGDGSITIGVTDHAQESLGDLVFIELPEESAELAAEDACAVVESVKAASDIYAPVAGTVTAVNSTLEDAPEQVNQTPYGEGWLFKMQVTDVADLNGLLTADEYAAETED
jgi:glycine cleavage system H protein